MSNSAIHELILRIIVRNQEGHLSWEEGLKGAVRASLADYTIELESKPSRDEELPDIIFRIRDKNGRLVDQIDDVSLAEQQESPQGPQGPTWYQLMEGLYRSASRKARGADVAIQKLLKELE